jgi:hypothetical protein
MEPRVLRSRGWNAVAAAVLLAAAAFCGVIGAATGSPVATVGCLAVSTLPLVVGAVRVWTVGVLVTPDGLVVRELLHTTKLPWAVLRGARVVTGRTVRGPVLSNPVLEYAVPARHPPEDGDDDAGTRSVTVTALGAYRRATAQRWVDELNDLIQRHRARRAG